MTYMILDDKTGILIHRSRVRSALDPERQNKRVDFPPEERGKDEEDLEPAEEYVEYVKSHKEDEFKENPRTTMPTIDIESIIGRTYLTEPTEDGTRH